MKKSLTKTDQTGAVDRKPGTRPTLVTRSSATAERQRVSYVTSLTDRPLHSAVSTASVSQLYNRLAKLVGLSILSANKPCDMRTFSCIGHSRSFKVILVGADRNSDRCVVVMCN